MKTWNAGINADIAIESAGRHKYTPGIGRYQTATDAGREYASAGKEDRATNNREESTYLQ